MNKKIEIVSLLQIEIMKALKKLNYYNEEFQIEIEIPKDKSHGDYASNVAMKLARIAKKNPRIIAEEIIANFDKDAACVETVEIAGAGFINFTIKLEYIASVVNIINKLDDEYGTSTKKDNERVNLEFVSANPTGYLHVGHGRGAAYGDSLARIMKKAGINVSKEHYVNDAGNQIINMARSVYERYKELFGLECILGDDHYHGKEIITIAEKIKNEYGDKYLNNYDEAFFKEYGTKELLGNLKSDLKGFNVEFDTWFSEKSLYANNEVQNVIKLLTERGFTYESEGAVWLKTSLYNDEKDRVIIKSDGSYTYLLPDIAYHANKLNRGYSHLIDVLGADHHGYIDRLKAAITMVGGNSDLLDVEILQMVRVMENGVEVKMSKRSGKAITLNDLIEMVGVDALRYFYVEKSLNTHMDLNLDLMKKKSSDNPVYYAGYAHARIVSVFKKFESLGNKFTERTEFNHINLTTVKDLCMLLIQYPDLISEIANSHQVHRLTKYIQDLAYALHTYYNDEKIITDDVEETNEKLTILNAVRIILKDSMQLIGVTAPEAM